MPKTAEDGWWIVAQIVLPWSAILRSSLTTNEALLASSPVVGYRMWIKETQQLAVSQKTKT